MLVGLSQLLGLEQVLDGFRVLVEGTMGENGVKLVDEIRLELLAGLAERDEGLPGLVLEEAHACEFVVGRLEPGVDLEDGLEVCGRLVQLVEVTLDSAEHE